jgi:hypothetical protein
MTMTYHHWLWWLWWLWLIIIDYDDLSSLTMMTMMTMMTYHHWPWWLWWLIIYNALILSLFDYGYIIWGDKNNSYPYPKPLNNAPYPYPKPLKPSTNYTGNHLPAPTQTTPNTNHTEFNIELPKINHLYNTRRRDDIGYTSVSRRQAGESKNCFTRLVKSTTIWTIA